VVGQEVNPLARFFSLIAIVWTASWLPLGLWVGDFDYVLTTVSRGTWERQFYQGLLYGGLFLVFLDTWRRHAPEKPKWGSGGLFGFYFVQGFIATVVLRTILFQAGLVEWNVPDWSLWRLLEVILSCLAVALIEEAIFRGFLLGTLVQRFGWAKGVVLTSFLFAVVHLFRPGTLAFKLSYGVGLLVLAYLLASIAWKHDSILASAGFHAGMIFLNLWTQVSEFKSSMWSGENSEPVSGLLSLVLTLLFLGVWKRLVNKREG
jgi:membrane protease YdiL (CAAX protease family)